MSGAKTGQSPKRVPSLRALKAKERGRIPGALPRVTLDKGRQDCPGSQQDRGNGGLPLSSLPELLVLFVHGSDAQGVAAAVGGAGKRQEKAHPHFVGFDPAGKNLHAVDLGLDQVKIYPWHAGRGIDTKAVEIIRLHAGAGPRHLVFSPDGNTIYVANELDSTVSSFVRRGGKWEAAQTIRSLNGVPETRNYPGAIRITKDGRFLFVSNRGHNSIALIETGKNGAMKLLETADCNGDFPRDIALSPDETEIIAANEKSGTVTFLMFDRENRKLVPKKEKLAFPRALGIYFRM